MSVGLAAESDKLLCCMFAETALWFASVGDACALLVEATARGGDSPISSILRMEAGRGGVESPVLGPAIEPGLGGGGASISSMLLTGDRGVSGEEARPASELP
jgi:hypothetical protein